MNQYLASALIILVSWLLGYLMGSFPTGVVIGKVFFGKDPRDYYSHNSGGTNVGRVFGKKVGLICIFFDMFKAAIPLYVSWAVITFTGLQEPMMWGTYNAAPIAYWGAAMMAGIGHCFSIFLGFKGGKAVSCLAGVNVVTGWLVPVTGGLVYLIVRKTKGIVSIASLLMSCMVMIGHWTMAIIGLTTDFNVGIFTWSFGFGTMPVFGIESAVAMTVLAILVFVRHIPNIKRLMAGTELKAKVEKVEN